MAGSGRSRKFVLVLIFIVIFSYWKIFSGFFQQDEWLGFARHILLSDMGARELLGNIFLPYSPHYIPLSFLLINLLFSLFGLNYLGYAVVSIALHIITVLLVFYLARLVFKKDLPAFLTALLFGIGAAGFQATAWVVADIATHGATIFGLLSLILLFRFLEKKEEKLFTLSLLSLIISLLFKEITFGLFLFIPLALYILAKNQLSKNQKYLRITAIVAGIYILARAAMLFLPTGIPSATVVQSQPPAKIVYNIVSVPMKAVSQTVIPPGQLREAAEFITQFLPEQITDMQGTPAYEVFVVKRTLEALSLGLFFLITLVVLLLWTKARGKNLANVIVASFSFMLINSLVFAFAPEREGVIFLIDSRNLYFVSVGTTLLLVSVALVLTKGRFGKVLLLLLPFFFLNFFWLQNEIDVLVERGTERRQILSEIKREYTNLPDKVVFYTESDSSFFGITPQERILPFQSGFGQTLLAWYYPTEDWPGRLFEDRFLWEITEQGYRESGTRGFGYFREFEQLAETVSENQLSPDSVIAFRYDSESQKIEDMTQEVRGRLEGYFTKIREIQADTILVEALVNTNDAQLAVDGDRNTAWDSLVPYARPQYFQIDLGRTTEIAQIKIDSYNNRDQNQVGYRVLLSGDGQNWQEVFYARRYPPDGNGLVDLYFQPRPAHFIKIEQIGYHEFASWVIHELKVYEKID